MKKLILVIVLGVFVFAGRGVEASTAAFRACVAGRINDRDNAIIASNAGRATVINNMIALRRSHLYSNWINITDDQARKAANQAEWASYISQNQIVNASYANERQIIWGNFRAYVNQCKALNGPNANQSNQYEESYEDTGSDL